jgi:hypothetical protein
MVFTQKYITAVKKISEIQLEILTRIGFISKDGELECKSTQTPIKKKNIKMAIIM